VRTVWPASVWRWVWNTVTCALAPTIVSTNSVRNPDRTARVAISAKTASVMPIRLIHVMTDTPPSARLARR
jgi:hypothetical protein